MLSWFRKPKRRLWLITDKESGRYIAVLDLDQIVAFNVPDIDQPGCAVTLKSGMTITFTNWDAEMRDRQITAFLTAVN